MTDDKQDPSVRVKGRQLEWRHYPHSFPCQEWMAQTPFGTYIIEQTPQDPETGHPVDGDWWFSLTFNGTPCPTGPDLEAAQAAAQRDFEARISRCEVSA